jgi:hypothetical protein
MFIDTISQQYAGEVIIGESQKIGFQPIKYQQNSDGSNTLVLERWIALAIHMAIIVKVKKNRANKQLQLEQKKQSPDWKKNATQC